MKKDDRYNFAASGALNRSVVESKSFYRQDTSTVGFFEKVENHSKLPEIVSDPQRVERLFQTVGSIDSEIDRVLPSMSTVVTIPTW